MTLNLANNEISSLNSLNKDYPDSEENPKWKCLTFLNLSDNKITELVSVKAPNLKELNLNNNDIKRLDKFEGHENLEELVLSNNQITDSSKLKNMPNLKRVYLVK